MKLVILDPDLTAFGGHNFNYIEGIVGEARRRGIETRIFAFRGIDPRVAAALGAEGHFTVLGRSVITDVEGGLAVRTAWTHIVMNAVFKRDLHGLPHHLGPETIVFVPAATSRQLFALAQWMSAMEPASMPTLVALVRYDLDAYPDERDLLQVPVTVLGALKHSAVLCCETDESASVHSMALGVPFETLPIPLVLPLAGLRPRTASARVRVGCFGDARPVKGFHLLPALAELACQPGAAFTLCIQTFLFDDDTEMSRHIGALKRLAAIAPEAVELRLGQVDLPLYHRRMRDCDIVLIPYSPKGPVYKSATSAVLCEAVSAGRVVVVPEGTWMSAILRRFGIEPASFVNWEVESIYAALRTVIEDLDQYTRVAQRLSGAWHAINGPAAVLDKLTAWHLRRGEQRCGAWCRRA